MRFGSGFAVDHLDHEGVPLWINRSPADAHMILLGESKQQ